MPVTAPTKGTRDASASARASARLTAPFARVDGSWNVKAASSVFRSGVITTTESPARVTTTVSPVSPMPDRSLSALYNSLSSSLNTTMPRTFPSFTMGLATNAAGSAIPGYRSKSEISACSKVRVRSNTFATSVSFKSPTRMLAPKFTLFRRLMSRSPLGANTTQSSNSKPSVSRRSERPYWLNTFAYSAPPRPPVAIAACSAVVASDKMSEFANAFALLIFRTANCSS